MKTTRIPKEKIILFNPLYVYFLDGKKVFRAKRHTGRGKGASSCSHESNSGKFVLKDTLKHITQIHKRGTPKTVSVLRSYGVEMI